MATRVGVRYTPTHNTMRANEIQQLTTRLLRCLVRYNDALEVIADEGSNTVTVSIRCHYADMPRVIGRKGAHFKALREILTVIGRRSGRVVNVPRLMPAVVGIGQRDFHPPFKLNPNWPREEIGRLIHDTANACFGPVGFATVDRDTEHRMFSIVTDAGSRAEATELAEAFQVLFSSIATSANGSLSVDLSSSR